MEKTDKKQVEQVQSNPVEDMIAYLELNEEEILIFEQLKNTLIEKCGLLEFEALDKDKGQDYVHLITYIKNKRVFIEDDGVIVKLRKPLVNKEGLNLGDQVKVLFNRNEAREIQFTKGKKIKEGDITLQKEYSRAALAASLDNIQVDNRSMMLSPSNISEKYVHGKDYALLMSCYNLFRG